MRICLNHIYFQPHCIVLKSCLLYLHLPTNSGDITYQMHIMFFFRYKLSYLKIRWEFCFKVMLFRLFVLLFNLPVHLIQRWPIKCMNKNCTHIKISVTSFDWCIFFFNAQCYKCFCRSTRKQVIRCSLNFVSVHFLVWLSIF
jgi:hypothetical protein